MRASTLVQHSRDLGGTDSATHTPTPLTLENQERMIMKPGDCFTIEPPIVQGNKPRGTVWDDGWTVATDVSCRAPAEHS